MNKYLLFKFFMLIGLIAYNQQKDAEVWTGLSLEAKPSKSLNLGIDLQSRFNENARQHKTNFFQFNLGYEVLPDLVMSFGYRLANKNRQSYYETINRIALDLNYALKIKPLRLRLKVRARYQHAFDRLMAVNEYILPRSETILRLKFNSTFKPKAYKSIRLFLGGELFYDPYENDVDLDIEAYRLFTGVQYKISKKHRVRFRYIFESSTGDILNHAHVYELTYRYRIKPKFNSKRPVKLH